MAWRKSAPRKEEGGAPEVKPSVIYIYIYIDT